MEFGVTVDGLRRSVTEADPAVGALVALAAQRYRAPVRVQVTGRAGVGRSAIVEVLGPIEAEIVETVAWDVPGADDPELTAELIVLVVCDPPRRADRDAAEAAGKRGLVVLNKAGTLADPVDAAERAASALGVPCLPVDGRSGSGVDELRDAVTERLAAIRAARAAALLAAPRALRGIASVRDTVEEYLAGDEALRRARVWRGRMNGGFDARRTRAALTLHRTAVRRWARGELR